MLVVASAVKAKNTEAGLMSAGDFPEALSAKVETLISDAQKRASANGRKTVRGEDL